MPLSVAARGGSEEGSDVWKLTEMQFRREDDGGTFPAIGIQTATAKREQAPGMLKPGSQENEQKTHYKFLGNVHNESEVQHSGFAIV